MNKTTAFRWIPSKSFFVGSLGITSLVMFTTIFTLFPITTIPSESVISLVVLSLSLALNLTALFYAGFTHGIRNRGDSILKDHRSMIASIGTTQGLAVVMGLLNHVTTTELLVIVSMFQIWGTFLFFNIVQNAFQVTPERLRYGPYLAAAGMAVFPLCAIPLRNWFTLTSIMNAATLWHALVLGGGLTGLVAWVSWSPGMRLSPRSLRESLQLRLAGSIASGSRMSLLVSGYVSFVLSLFAWTVSQVASSGGSEHLPIWIIAGYSSLFVPAWYLSWLELREQAGQQAELIVSSKLAGAPALRFLKRNLRDDNAWAAAVGLRTAVFVIDHDPDNAMSSALPATLSQIRNEEITRCVNEVLAHRVIHNHAAGQRIFGAVDPEQSARPCVDTLKLFACLYLDAGPLIERRINGLAALLPIVNPGLSRVLKPDVLATLLKRNQWFFHFDYHWVDQHMINTPSSTRYGVHLDPLSADLRQAMVDHLRKAQGMGSFLWLNKDAQERLLQEAPMLAPIVEPLTLKTHHDGDHLVFVIKFENLVPRLQRYFDLDHTRKVLMDFDPGIEATKLVNIFKLQASQAKTPEEMTNIVEALASYPWRGFKEKDQALKIIVLAHQYASHAMTTLESQTETKPKSILKLQSSIQQAVERIGYPAQILHHAQMHKIVLRDMKQLVKAARDPMAPRFDESWILLSSMDFRRYNREERELVSALVVDALALNQVLERGDIHSKAIYAIVNLVKAEIHFNNETFNTAGVLSDLTLLLTRKSASAETLTVLLDALAFTSQLSGREVKLTTKAHHALEGYIKGFEHANSSYAAALWSRWIEFRQRQKNINAA